LKSRNIPTASADVRVPPRNARNAPRVSVSSIAAQRATELPARAVTIASATVNSLDLNLLLSFFGVSCAR